MTTIPYFALCEDTGKYQARRKLTEDQIIKAAKKLLEQRVCRGFAIRDMDKAHSFLIHYFWKHRSEAFVCLFLDSQHRLIAVEELFKGTIDEAKVYPREIVRRCLELNAAAIIFAHNHPSGDVSPSQADRNLTQDLVKLLNTIDVHTLDHWIIGGGLAYSFKDHGLI